MSAPHVSHPPADQQGLAHMVVVGFQEIVEVWKGDRLGIHMNFFTALSNGQCKNNKVIPDPRVENRL